MGLPSDIFITFGALLYGQVHGCARHAADGHGDWLQTGRGILRNREIDLSDPNGPAWDPHKLHRRSYSADGERER
jgi:hypothetical protein